MAPLGGSAFGSFSSPLAKAYAPPGTTYKNGGYVSTPDVGTQEHARSTMPLSNVDPMGNARTYNYDTGNWDLIGQVPGAAAAGGGGGTGTRTAGSGGSTYRDTTDIDRLIDEIRSSGGDYEPPSIPVVTSGDLTKPYDEKAQAAAYGAAKERTGLAMQAAMRGLRANLLQRGITGSGIDAEMTGGIFEKGLGQLADTDRQLAEEAADRAFTAEQSNTDRTISQNRINADYLERQRAAKAQEWERKMEMISRLTSLKY